MLYYMKLMDVIAILGAMAWLPQIITWVYKWLRRPVVSIFHDTESEVGYIKNGCAFNVRLSFLSRKKHALIDDITLQLTDKNGASHILNWIWYSETLYELLGPEGNATMAKQQNAIAINAYEDALIEKFVGFQSIEFIEERKRLSYQLQSYIEDQRTGGCLNVDQVRASKQYNDLVRHYKNCFQWKAGEYKCTLKVHIADTNQTIEHKFKFVLSDIEEDTLRKNLEVAKMAIDCEFIDPSSPITSSWIWAKPSISSK